MSDDTKPLPRPMLTYCALDDQCWLIVRWTTNADLLCVGRPMLTYCALDDQCWLIVRWTTNADLLCVGHLRPLLPTEISTLRPRQNRCHFADAIFKCVSWMKMHELRLRFHWNLFLQSHICVLIWFDLKGPWPWDFVEIWMEFSLKRKQFI